jgi:Ca2+-transporting ATPase
MNYYLLPIAEVFQLLQTSKQGLRPNQVEQRFSQFGPNELQGKPPKSIGILILHQFKDIMIFILLAAACISVAIGEIKDALVVMIVVVLNAIIGFVQEYRAEKAIEALKKMSSPNTIVRREEGIVELPVAHLVPGDLVILEAGMLVPADLRLIDCQALKIEEASLTGESLPIEKNTEEIFTENIPLGDRVNMAYKSTIVTYGRGEGLVVVTGMNTEIGKIAKLLGDKEVKTPLQVRLSDFGKKLSLGVLLICVVIYVAGLMRGEEPIKMLLTAISVAVAAIPEALPAVITIALALGAKRMVAKNALVRKLSAVETLGSVSYICSDKTGTITQNKMTVTDTCLCKSEFGINGIEDIELLPLVMELNHDVIFDNNRLLKGDPTEIALVEYTRANNHYKPTWSKSFTRIHELPFDSVRKIMTTIVPYQHQYLVISKGAAENISDICSVVDKNTVIESTAQYAQQGKRVLAYAYKLINQLPISISHEYVERDMIFIGLVAMIDPPRPEAVQAISDCYSAGITPVMITGDHPITAKAIAQQTGILKKQSDRVITGHELSKLSTDEYAVLIESIKVYARVSPEQKLDIVKALQAKQHYVAMTGDGVNDAPALKRANIGVAMGITGTDVSKEAAHMILLDDNFASIIKAVAEGRRIFDNIRKFIKYTMTSNSGEIWTIFLAPLLGLPIPLLPIHILWINLVTDGLPGLALASEKAENDVLKRPPRKPNDSIFDDGLGINILWIGLLMGGVCIATQAWAIQQNRTAWMTMVFTVLSFSQLGNALAIRSNKESIFKLGFWSNKPLLLSIILTVLLQLAIIYVPFLQQIFRTQSLSLQELILCIALSSIVFWAIEIEKWLKMKNQKQ